MMREDSKKRLIPWRNHVAFVASQEMKGRPLLDCPVYLSATFYFLKPKSAKQSDIYKGTKPDLSKLIRAVEDAMTQVVYVDDSRIVGVGASKLFGDPPRVEIVVSDVTNGSIIHTLRPR